jgi:hypothetical protein
MSQRVTSTHGVHRALTALHLEAGKPVQHAVLVGLLLLLLLLWLVLAGAAKCPAVR